MVTITFLNSSRNNDDEDAEELIDEEEDKKKKEKKKGEKVEDKNQAQVEMSSTRAQSGDDSGYKTPSKNKSTSDDFSLPTSRRRSSRSRRRSSTSSTKSVAL